MPSLAQVAVLHFVGRDKPWQRFDQRALTPDTAASMCRRLRSQDAQTCKVYLELQALWWKEFGRGACIIVGEGAHNAGQGFVIEQFEVVMSVPPHYHPGICRSLTLW